MKRQPMSAPPVPLTDAHTLHDTIGYAGPHDLPATSARACPTAGGPPNATPQLRRWQACEARRATARHM